MIAGFPGETESDVETLREFIIDANLDFLGVFGYSDEEGTEGEGLDAPRSSRVASQALVRSISMTSRSRSRKQRNHNINDNKNKNIITLNVST